MDMLGRPFKRRATEFEARVIQHEVDHLDGILFIEKADPETLHWLMPGEKDDEGEEGIEE
jgi:peptide deformylase